MTRLYDSASWRKVLRPRQLQREPLCRMCKEQGKLVPAEIVDHIKPHRGDPALFFDENNLASLCKQHHDSGKQSFEKTGKSRGCDVRGIPIGGNW